MKKYAFFLMLTSTMVLSLNACKEAKKEEPVKLIGRSEVKVENGRLTPEILNLFGRVTDPQLSPDGKTIVYGVSFASIEENRSNRELFTMNVDGSNPQQITHTPKGEANARWTRDGKKIAYLTGGQIWTMNPDGSSPVQVSDYAAGISEFEFSPDGKQILFVSEVKAGKRPTDLFPDLPKATAYYADDLMYRHWDEWVETAPHPFFADFDGKTLANITDILEGEPYECPTKPFGGINELSWSPDGKHIAYSCRKKVGRDYAFSTNTDIYLYDVAAKKTIANLTEGMMGYDVQPAFSPDGQWLAWESMEREGYEADKNRLFVMNMGTKEKTYLTEKFDYNAGGFTWNNDSKTIYMASCVKALTHIYTVNIEDKTIAQLSSGICDYDAPAAVGEQLITLRRTMSCPNEIYAINAQTGEATQLSFENKPILDQLTMGKVEERWMKTVDGKQMHTWIVYPPNFDANKKYPAIMMCLGGPQGTISQGWSYRWNYQLMAANDYIVILPNRRGTTAFGQEWCEQISGDYGGLNMQDYLTSVDVMAKEPFVDAGRIGCAGASYGGFSVYWLAGHHNKRFKAFIAHAGIFNVEHMYMTTEEMWFNTWDNGGAPWEKNNKIAQRTYANSPHLFVDKWDTPILVTHGEKDYRVPFDQGMAAFNAAKTIGVPAEMLIFPDENHWILKPQNSVLWHTMFYRWMDKWLKK